MLNGGNIFNDLNIKASTVFSEDDFIPRFVKQWLCSECSEQYLDIQCFFDHLNDVHKKVVCSQIEVLDTSDRMASVIMILVRHCGYSIIYIYIYIYI